MERFCSFDKQLSGDEPSMPGVKSQSRASQGELRTAITCSLRSQFAHRAPETTSDKNASWEADHRAQSLFYLGGAPFPWAIMPRTTVRFRRASLWSG